MLSKSVNGYTEAAVNRALKALDGRPLYRVRAELLDQDNALLFPLDGVLEEGNVSQNTFQPLKSGAELRLLRTVRDDEHSAPLDTFAATVLAQGPLIWLRCNDASGNLTDSSGNGRTFTANGGITYGVGSLTAGDLSNNAIKFNGTTGFLSIADASWMNVTRITLRVAWSGTDVSQTLIDRDDGTTRFWRLATDASGCPSLMMGFTTGVYTTYSTTVSINDGQPHLVECSYDGAYIDIYIDGKRASHTAETRTMKTTGTMGIRVGATNVPSGFSSGIFDEIAILDRATTPREKRDTYQTWSARLNEFLTDKNYDDRFKIYYGVKMPTAGTDGSYYAEWPQIVAVPTSPADDYSDTGTVISITCQDQARVLQDSAFSSVTTLLAGANYITGANGILAIAQSAGFNTAGWAVTPTTLVAPADVAFEISSTKLDAINYLLTVIGYKLIRFNGDGAAIIEPSKLDIDLPLSDTFDSRTPSILGAEKISRRLEPRKVVSQVIVQNANPDVADLLGLAVLNAGTGPIKVIQIDVPDQTTADAIAIQELTDEVARAAERIVLDTLPYPIFDDRDKVRLVIPELPIDGEYVSEGWTLPLDTEQMMSHTFLSVVDVTA